MADTYTIAAAARLCHVDRRTLQRAITTGRLRLDADHRLSREDLIAAGYWFTEGPLAAPQDTPQDTPQELMEATALLALLERLTTAIADLHEEVQVG